MIINGISYILSEEELREFVKKSVDERFDERINELKKANEKKTYLSTDDICALFSVKHITVGRWKKKGLIQAVTVGGRVLFPREEVEKAVKNQPLIMKAKRRKERTDED